MAGGNLKQNLYMGYNLRGRTQERILEKLEGLTKIDGEKEDFVKLVQKNQVKRKSG